VKQPLTFNQFITMIPSHQMGATVVEFTGNRTLDHFVKFAVRLVNFFQKVKFIGSN
jgi:hypothetical protein